MLITPNPNFIPSERVHTIGGQAYYIVQGSLSVLSPEHPHKFKHKGIEYNNLRELMDNHKLSISQRDKVITRELKNIYVHGMEDGYSEVLLRTGGIPIVYASAESTYGIGHTLHDEDHILTGDWSGESRYTQLMQEEYTRLRKLV